MDGRERFERNPGFCLGGILGHRPAYQHPGEFLGRLWSLFGTPDHVGDGGFDYALRDRVSGLAFNVYSGASGPAYGVNPADRAAIGPVLDAFDHLLAQTAPVDCSIEYESEEWGPYRVGCLGGRAFEGPLPAELVRLLQTIDKAKQNEPSDNPWTTMRDLGRLYSIWRLTPSDEGVAVEARARAAAAALLEATFESAASLAACPAGAPFRESFAEAGLDELRTLVKCPLLAASDRERRSRARRIATLAARFKA